MTSSQAMDAFGASFDAAWAAAPVGEAIERRYAFGGLPLVVRSTSQALADELDRPLLPADHGAPPASAGPTLRADLWDASGGTPAATWTGLILDEHRRTGSATETVSSSDGRAIGFSGPGFCLWLDVPGRRIVGWVEQAGALAAAHQYRTFAALIGPWLAGTGIEVLHASAVADDHGALVLVGPSGVGKSTCAIACARAGMVVLSDDLVGLDLATGTAHTIYTIIKQRQPPADTDQEAVPFLNPDGEREWVTYLRNASPVRLQASARPVAIGLPALSDRSSSRIEPMSPAAGTRALVAADQRPGTELGARLVRWGDVVDRMPVCRFHVGRDPEGIATTIRSMLANALPGA